MKTITTILLVLVLAWTPLHAGESTNTPPTEKSLALAAFLISAALVAGAIVIYVQKRDHQPTGPVDVVLEGSADNVHWNPILTNTVVLNGRLPIEIYREHPIRRDGRFYRAKVSRPTGSVTNLLNNL